MSHWFVVPAAGTGRRFGGELSKQYVSILGKTLIEHTLERLLSINSAGIIVAINSEDERWDKLSISRHAKIFTVQGGRERADSVKKALLFLEGKAKNDDWVLVHDVARPCVCASDIYALMAALKNSTVGGILASPVSDTLKRVNSEQQIIETLDRNQLWSAQTPQMFRFSLLCEALNASLDETPTDEAMAVEKLGYSPRIVVARGDNIKVTFGEDIAHAETIIRRQSVESQADMQQSESTKV